MNHQINNHIDNVENNEPLLSVVQAPLEYEFHHLWMNYKKIFEEEEEEEVLRNLYFPQFNAILILNTPLFLYPK